jgi:hypothetical protein
MTPGRRPSVARGEFVRPPVPLHAGGLIPPLPAEGRGLETVEALQAKTLNVLCGAPGRYWSKGPSRGCSIDPRKRRVPAEPSGSVQHKLVWLQQERGRPKTCRRFLGSVDAGLLAREVLCDDRAGKAGPPSVLAPGAA